MRWRGATPARNRPARPARDWAGALRGLASLVRAGVGTHAALIDWYRDSPESLAPHLLRLSRRLQLGASIEEAFSSLEEALGPDGAVVAAVLAAHRHLGGDLGRTLDSLAAQVERRGASLEIARAAGAGAVLSGRIVAGLPMLFLAFAPAARAPLFDAAGLTMLAVGAALAVGGLVWIERLVPSPAVLDDPVALVGDVVAGLLDGGTGLTTSLEVVSQRCPESLRPAFERARRLVRLGEPWPEALTMCGDAGLEEMASSVRRAGVLGLPLAKSLGAWAESRRARRERAFEAAVKKAPVLMVVPLTVCLLPSYVVLAMGPFLRNF